MVLVYNSEFFLYDPILATTIVPNNGIVINEDNNISSSLKRDHSNNLLCPPIYMCLMA